MKNIFIITFILCSSLFGQIHFYTELSGFEDSSGITQLFYNKYHETIIDVYNGSTDEIKYRYDTSTDIEYFFWHCFHSSLDRGYEVNDFEFESADYRTFCAVSHSDHIGTPTFYYEFYPSGKVYLDADNGTLPYNLEISASNKNYKIISYAEPRWYETYLMNFKTTDNGKTWKGFAPGYKILSLSPFNDSILFATNDTSLFKSTDGGTTFKNVSATLRLDKNFLYDKDKLHIYAFSPDKKEIHVSDNEGNQKSWRSIYKSNDILCASIDTSSPGSIYIADGKIVYYSADYGKTFEIFSEFYDDVVGLYKKPLSPVLYTATKYHIIEINDTTETIIEEIIPDSAVLQWLPLAKGNKWIFRKDKYDNYPYLITQAIWSVEDVASINGNMYSVIGIHLYDSSSTLIKTDSLYFRLDALRGIIYYIKPGFKEGVFADFSVWEDDTLYNDSLLLWLEEGVKRFAGDYYYSKLFFHMDTHSFRINELVYGIGFGDNTGYLNDDHPYMLLFGAIINSKVYGDTVFTAVEEDIATPTEYSLSQNYPNPFNPSTRINYSIKNREHVTLKIYNILGTHIVTIVNEEKPAGEYEVIFDAANYNLSSGVYFYTITAGDFTETKKFTLLK